MKMKKKVFVIILSFVMCFSLAACGGESSDNNQDKNAGGNDEKVYELKATWCAGEATAIVQSWYKFRDKIEADSNGRIKVTTYHTGQISGSDRENAEKVAANICQFTTIPSATMAEFSGLKEYDALSIPYLATSDAQLDGVYDAGIFDEINGKFLEKTGMRCVGSFSTGWVALGMRNGEVRSAADIKGQKIRSMSTTAQLETLKAWGAAPTPMSIGELFTGLQQGTVNGALAAEQLFDSEGYGEILSSVTDIAPFCTYHIGIVNEEWYNSLPDDLKTIFDDCMKYYFEVCRKAQLEATANAYKNLEAAGCKYVALTDEERGAFAEAAKPVYDSMAEQVGADFVKKIADAIAQGR